MKLLGNVRWLLALLGLLSLVSISLGEDGTEVPSVDTPGDSAATSIPTNGTDQGGEEGNGNSTDVEELLPEVMGDDSENWVKNFIYGSPEYYTKVYDPPGMVPKLNKLPRFSHSGDFSKLMGDKPHHYFLGLLFIGTFICSVFVFWGIVILIFKCIGPKHVGVLAGFPFREEGKKSAAGRMTLSISAWMMIIATIVLITKGMTEMQSLSDTVGMTNQDIKMIEKEVQQIVTTLLVVSAKTIPIRDELVDFLKRDICPLEPGSDTEDQIRSVGEDTYDAMVDLDDFIDGYLNDVESGVNQTSTFTDSIDGMVDKLQFTNNWKVTMILFPYFIVPAFILVAVCMGWFDVFSEGFYTFITWVILPMMILLTIGAIISSSMTIIFLQANTDLCMPTPENTILNILDTIDFEPDNSGSESMDENGPSDNFFYDIMMFYTHQCTKPNPWEFLEGHYTDLSRGTNILGEFVRSIEDTTIGQLSQECGHEYGPIVELLLQLQDLITLLAQVSVRALNLMSCRNIVPLYTTAVYEATCTMSPVGLTWIFSCALVIAFFGMLAITFRGAYYPIDYYYYDEKDIYPTESESGDEIEEVLADNECNDLVKKKQKKQLKEAIGLLRREKDQFDIYSDSSVKNGADTGDVGAGAITDDETTNRGASDRGDHRINAGGESYSISTFTDHGFGSTYDGSRYDDSRYDSSRYDSITERETRDSC